MADAQAGLLGHRMAVAHCMMCSFQGEDMQHNFQVVIVDERVPVSGLGTRGSCPSEAGRASELEGAATL